MGIIDVALELALNNLRAKRERTILTITSVTLAVIITILLVSISDRVITSMRHAFSQRKVDIYCFPPQVPIELGPITVSSASNYIPLKLADDLEVDTYLLRFSPHVTVVQKMMINYQGYNLPLMILDLKKLHYFYPKLLKERLMTEVVPSGGERRGTVVLGYNVAKMFQLSVGDEMILLNERFVVIKVLPRTASYDDYTIFMDFSQVRDRLNLEGAHQLWISFDYPLGRSEAEILDYLRRNYPMYSFYTSQQIMNSQLGSAKALRLLQFAIALVGILIAFTATTNTMLISTYERLREFGILLALGAPRSMVFTSIMTEGIVVSTLGGITGIVLGLLSMQVLELSLRNLFKFAFPLTGISLTTFVDIVFIIFGLGALSSLVPAYIASNLQVARALRWE